MDECVTAAERKPRQCRPAGTHCSEPRWLLGGSRTTLAENTGEGTKGRPEGVPQAAPRASPRGAAAPSLPSCCQLGRPPQVSNCGVRALGSLAAHPLTKRLTHILQSPAMKQQGKITLPPLPALTCLTPTQLKVSRASVIQYNQPYNLNENVMAVQGSPMNSSIFLQECIVLTVLTILHSGGVVVECSW